MELFDLQKWQGFVAAGGNASQQTTVDQITIDSRRIYSSRALFVSLKGKTYDGHLFVNAAADAGAQYALVQKKWNPNFCNPKITLLRVENPLQAFQEIAKAYRAGFSCQVIGIAGSYGKTMVKDLLHAILGTTKKVVASPESFNSQIGVPLSLLLIKKDTEIALIEAGISQIGEMEVLANMIDPQCCVLTHIGRKHLPTLGSLENITREMMIIAKKIPSDGWVFLPQTSSLSQHINDIKSQKYFWNLPEKGLPYVYKISKEKSQHSFHIISFPDGTQYENSSGHDYFVDLLNLAIKPSWLLGISSDNIRGALKNYTPQPMRREIWQSPFGTTFVNDPYSSDPFSIDQSLDCFNTCPSDSKKIFLFGGLRGEEPYRTHDYMRVGNAIAKAKLDMVVLIGNHPFTSLVEEIKKHPLNISISTSSSYIEALKKLKEFVKPQDFVLIKGDKKIPLDTLTEAFHGSICPNQCFINLAAIEANLAIIQQKLGKLTRLMIMVKASAYGTNDIRMAKFLARKGVDIFGVSYVDEGIALKRAGITQSIFSLHASPYEAIKLVEWDLEVGVSDKSVIFAIAQAASQKLKKIKVHLHVDTGMNRLGCRPEEALSLAKEIIACPSLKLEGIMTHFASADDQKEDPFTFVQIERFNTVLHTLCEAGIEIPWRHAANSSAMIRFPLPQCNMARIGLALYGLNSSKATREALDLRPALSLTSRIAGINQCKKGESVSYGRNYIIEQEEQRIAVIPVGYFDGLHRNYSGKSAVIIHGKKAPMVGSICMDFMMVDISDIPKASIGDSALLFGEDDYGNSLDPEELAVQGNSIPHELISCLGPRIQRVFVHEETQKSC
jgi:alanine racemase